MRSAAQKSAGSLRPFRSRLLIIRIIPRGILRKVYSAIPHKNVSNLCQVPYVNRTGHVPNAYSLHATIVCGLAVGAWRKSVRASVVTNTQMCTVTVYTLYLTTCLFGTTTQSALRSFSRHSTFGQFLSSMKHSTHSPAAFTSFET